MRTTVLRPFLERSANPFTLIILTQMKANQQMQPNHSLSSFKNNSAHPSPPRFALYGQKRAESILLCSGNPYRLILRKAEGQITNINSCLTQGHQNLESSTGTRRGPALAPSPKARGTPWRAGFARAVSNVGYGVLELRSGKAGIKAAAVRKSALCSAASSVTEQPVVFHGAKKERLSLCTSSVSTK